jgi:hypothetical protein
MTDWLQPNGVHDRLGAGAAVGAAAARWRHPPQATHHILLRHYQHR